MMEKLVKRRTTIEKKFWDSKAKGYDKVVNKMFSQIYKGIIENLLLDIDRSENLLEAATGTGLLAIKISNHVSHITAIDISPQMLQVAKEKTDRENISNIHFKIGDICNLEFEDKSFDTVLASNVLHLLFHPELALQEIRRVLDDNGKVILPTFCHGENLISNILSRLLWLLGQKTRSRWSQNTFVEFVKHHGFKIIKNIYVSGKIPLVYLVAVKNYTVK